MSRRWLPAPAPGAEALGARTTSPAASTAELLRASASLAGNRATAEALQGEGSPLEPSLREQMEARLGVDLTNVRVHRGPEADRVARRAEARALASGADVVIGAGEPGVGTAEGERLLAHELAHVAQWKRASSVREGWSEPGDGFEQQADAVAEGSTLAGAPQPAGAVPAASRKPRSGTTLRTDLLFTLSELRQRDPAKLAQFLGANEGVMSATLGPWGYRGCAVDDARYLADFDRAWARWFEAEGRVAMLQIDLSTPLRYEPPKRDETLVMGMLPNGQSYTGPRWAYHQEKERVYWQQKLQVLENIEGGPAGAIGYGIGGDEGSYVGASFDGLLMAAGSTAGARNEMRAINSAPAPRDVAAEVRPATPRPVETEPATAPRPAPKAEPAPTQPPASYPALEPAAVAPAAKPVPASSPKSGPSPKQAPSPKAAAPTWRPPWNALVTEAEVPKPRANDNGFRTQEAVSRDGRTRVVIVEGIVTDPVGGRSTADYGTILPGENSTHPVGRQLGEDTGPHSQASGPERLNLSNLKRTENFLRDAADEAAKVGATIETRTIMVSETRNVNGQPVPVLVGVRREAWLRMPGSDTLRPLFLYEVVVDPDTRAVHELTPPPTKAPPTRKRR
jgi:hypothetical protein